MKKQLGLVCIVFFGLSLLGCQDSADSKFNELAKQGIKDGKNIISLYDVKENKVYDYEYFHFHNDDVTEYLEELIDPEIIIPPTLKDCDVSPEEAVKAAKSDGSLVFSCISSYDETKETIKFIGKNSKENDDFLEKNDINSLVAFNKNSIHKKNIRKLEHEDEAVKALKERCNIKQDGQYDDCWPTARIIVTGL